ncbi:MAG TPA: hypothetical protein VFL90_07285 [Methylomirabilota bacterium]|nr:hypothetical protein [Methylomirabilota bacterium]
MLDPHRGSVTRRDLLRGTALVAAAPLLSAPAPARAATRVLDFSTGADLARASTSRPSTPLTSRRT